jgi:hypothetical protein
LIKIHNKQAVFKWKDVDMIANIFHSGYEQKLFLWLKNKNSGQNIYFELLRAFCRRAGWSAGGSCSSTCSIQAALAFCDTRPEEEPGVNVKIHIFFFLIGAPGMPTYMFVPCKSLMPCRKLTIKTETIGSPFVEPRILGLVRKGLQRTNRFVLTFNEKQNMCLRPGGDGAVVAGWEVDTWLYQYEKNSF